VSVLQASGLVLAGIGGGLTGSIAGLASLVTYPALLAVGLSPIGANVTNTAALVLSGVGSTVGSRPELVGQRDRIRRLLPLAAAGGITGAALALLTPSGAFARIVPWLILAGALAIFGDRAVAAPTAPTADADAADHRSLPWAVGLIAIYGGYFGAAAGVLLLARANAAKNILLGTANLSGAVVFAAFGPLRWSAAVPLGVGCLLGARLGPVLVRRLPPGLLRRAIGVAGIGLAVALAVRAY
jgi:uncharacterized membrane protein YfcA